jgi:tubulin-folding cofactor B
MRLHVIDTDPMSVSANGWLEDLSKVEKYVMSDEAYEKREGTYRQWARKKREEDPTWTLQKEQQKLRNQRKSTNEGEVDVEDAIAAAREKTLTTYSSFECVRHVVSGSRCEVNPGGKRGVACFVGKVADTAQQNGDVKEEEQKDVIDMPPSLPKGYWVGVKFDEPVGKNDGKTPCGKILIPDCPPMHGSFCRPDRVTCGDEFTEIDEFATSSEDEEI